MRWCVPVESFTIFVGCVVGLGVTLWSVSLKLMGMQLMLAPESAIADLGVFAVSFLLLFVWAAAEETVRVVLYASFLLEPVTGGVMLIIKSSGRCEESLLATVS
jgi:hypothetical protein